MSQGGTRTSALTDPQHGPAWGVCSFVAVAAAVLAAAAASSLALAYVPAAIHTPYVCLYHEPGLGWTGQKKLMFHVIDTLKLEAFKVLWISIPMLCILKGLFHKGGKP